MNIDEMKTQLESLRTVHDLTIVELSNLRSQSITELTEWLSNWPLEYARKIVQGENRTTSELPEQQLADLKQELKQIAQALPAELNAALESARWPQSCELDDARSYYDFHGSLKRHLRKTLGTVATTLKKYGYLPYLLNGMSEEWDPQYDAGKSSGWALADRVELKIPAVNSSAEFSRLARRRDELTSSIKVLDTKIKREEAASRWDSI